MLCCFIFLSCQKTKRRHNHLFMLEFRIYLKQPSSLKLITDGRLKEARIQFLYLLQDFITTRATMTSF